MMKDPRTPTPWVRIVSYPKHALLCLRCTRVFTLSLPMELWAVAALTEGFAKEHKDCALRTHGEVCEWCRKPGHMPPGCPAAEVETVSEWLDGPDTGQSSMAIVAAVTEINLARYGDAARVGRTPNDPSDFGRCYRLLKRFPDLYTQLAKVALKYPHWAPYVRAWDELTALYEEEAPSGTAPKLWERLKQLDAASASARSARAEAEAAK
jgi:hypothetical protein